MKIRMYHERGLVGGEIQDIFDNNQKFSKMRENPKRHLKNPTEYLNSQFCNVKKKPHENFNKKKP